MPNGSWWRGLKQFYKGIADIEVLLEEVKRKKMFEPEKFVQKQVQEVRERVEAGKAFRNTFYSVLAGVAREENADLCDSNRQSGCCDQAVVQFNLQLSPNKF